MVSSDYFPDILLSSPAEHTSGSPYQKLNPHKAGSLPRPRNAQVCPDLFLYSNGSSPPGYHRHTIHFQVTRRVPTHDS